MDIKEVLVEMAQATNDLGAKVMVLGFGMQEVMRVVPAASRTEIAERLRARVDQALLMHPGSGDMGMESSATLQLAALLEALGQPPKR